MPAQSNAPMKPLIMGTRSIIAWQQGAKTQTRRLVRPQLLAGKIEYCPLCHLWIAQEETRFELLDQPYAVGDLLWIREGLVRGLSAEVLYAVDQVLVDHIRTIWHWKRDKLPAMFMPRWACRYYARILSVRPERLQEISDADALAEGVLVGNEARHHYDAQYHGWYFDWWDSLHKKPGTRSEDNPHIWQYELEKVDASTAD